MSDFPPDWAIKRAIALLNAGRDDDWEAWDAADAMDTGTGVPQFALYIAAHEDEPEGPLLDEVQNLADELQINLSAMPWVENALLAALSRGMELAKEQG